MEPQNPLLDQKESSSMFSWKNLSSIWETVKEKGIQLGEAANEKASSIAEGTRKYALFSLIWTFLSFLLIFFFASYGNSALTKANSVTERWAERFDGHLDAFVDWVEDVLMDSSHERFREAFRWQPPNTETLFYEFECHLVHQPCTKGNPCKIRFFFFFFFFFLSLRLFQKGICLGFKTLF